MKKIILIVSLVFFVQLAGLFVLLVAHQGTSALDIYKQTDDAAKYLKISTQIVESMTLEQKVGQLIHIGMTGKSASGSVIKNIKQFHVGGVIQFAANFGNMDAVKMMNTGLQKAAVGAKGIPLFISTDQEGGRVYRIGSSGTVEFPGAMAMGQAGDVHLAEQAGFVTGYEMRKLGINLLFAPVLDINNNPANPVIQTRSFGSNKELVATMGLAYGRGMQHSRSTPVIKHFPGHGDTNVDSHLALPVISKTLAQLEQQELYPFRKSIEAGAEALMSAHILFPSLDKQYPATLSPIILKDILRRQLAYQGLIISDAMEMKAIARRYGQSESAVKAFAAGIDIILLTSEGPIIKKMYAALLHGFRSKKLSLTALDQAVGRQVLLKLKKGLFVKWNEPGVLKNPSSDWLITKYKQHQRESQSHYKAIQNIYLKKGLSLNTEISRRSIRSLTKGFDHIQNKHNIKLYYKTGITLDEARLRSLDHKALVQVRRNSRLYSILRIKKPATVIVEVLPGMLRTWNRLVKIMNTRKKSPVQLIGLYSGNPFLKIKTPENGVVLLSFSPTAESRRALLYRALEGNIKQTDLILSKNKK